MENTADNRFALLEIDGPPTSTPEAPAPAPAPTFIRLEDGGPIATPPPRKTVHGATMSPRMARFHSFLEARGVGFSDWATDGVISRMLPQLKALHVQLSAIENKHVTLVEFLADLDSTMRRVPENRVSDNTVAAQALPVETGEGYHGVRAAQGLVALSVEGKTTGAVMYWHLSGACDLSKLTEAWKAQGLDEKLLPTTPSETVALSRAAKSQASKHRLVRQHPAGGWVIVDEKETTDEDGKTTLDYEMGLRVRVEEKDGKLQLLATRAKECSMDGETIGRILQSIRAEYEKALTEVASQDISTWIVRLASWHLQAVALRETGGLYFVPSTHIETFRKMKAAIKVATSHVIYEIPAMHSDEAIAAVLDAIVNETETMLVEIQNEVVAKNFGARGVKSRLNALDEAREKVIGYSKLLGRDMTPLLTRITSLRVDVAAITTRGALLEVD